MKPEQLTQELKSLLGENLLSVVLYGSGAGGDQTKHYSNLNILAVVEKAGVELLKTVSPLVKKWRRDKNPAPLFLTRQALESSLDVFPIEFMDMKGSHQVLYGNDPFSAVAIDPANLRHQLEFELRGKLIQLETRFLETEGKERALRDLVLKAVSSITALFNAALRLAGEKPAEKKRDVWAALHARIPVDIRAFEEIMALREGRKSAVPARDLFTRLYASLERVIEFVDQSR